MDGKRAERVFMNNLANKTLRKEYMKKAQDIGSNAITLVKEFFDSPLGIVDSIDVYQMHQWTLTDLDRALDELSGNERPADKVEIKTVDDRANYKSKLKQWLRPYSPIYDTPSKKIDQEMKMFKHGWRLNNEL